MRSRSISAKSMPEPALVPIIIDLTDVAPRIGEMSTGFHSVLLRHHTRQIMGLGFDQ